jgi:signal transduction histidine kinase
VGQVVGCIGCGALVGLAEVLNPARPGLIFTAQHVAFLVAPMLAVEALRTRWDYRSLLGERLTLLKLAREQEAQRRVQDERLRIARELHDVVAHTLTTINVQASVAGHLLDSRPEQARHALGVIEEASRDGIAELRAILGVLRDPEGGATSRTPPPGLDDVSDLVDSVRGAGLEAVFDVVGERPARVPDAVSLAAYRIVQESLTNAARHTTGEGIHVRLSFTSDALAIAVENTTRLPHRSGAAGDAARIDDATSHLGIIGMAERAEALGGTLTANASETGFLVSARLPLRPGLTR